MELIKITEKEDGGRAVSARDLHAFLESKQDFTNWIKARITKYDLISGTDFVFQLWDMKLNKIIEPINQLVTGQYRTEFILTVDAAKELSMVEGNEKGKQARKYFIKCEKELKEQSQLPQTFAQALQLAADQAKQIELQESQMKEQAPKVLMAETLLLSDEAITLEKFAKSIGSFGRTKMFALLRDQGFLINKGSSKNIPYQKYITNGYFEVIEKPFMKPGDIKCIGTQTLITPKGQEKVLKIIKTTKI